jgi:hypothetical protein
MRLKGQAKLHTVYDVSGQDVTAPTRLSTPVLASVKVVFDRALTGGWGDLGISCALDQVSGACAVSPGAAS